MSIESKPLFHPEVIRQHVRNFDLPPYVAESEQKIQKWADLISSGQADKHKETDLLPDFLTDFFYEVLGYTRPNTSSTAYTLSREKHVEIDGKFADAVLGRFRGKDEEFIVALEGKGSRDPLDRPFKGRKMSAVDQAYRYAINLPCDWIIVTSMRETRLYHKGSNQHSFERFETVRLAKDAKLLKRFVFLLGAERVVPESGTCHLSSLLKESEKVGTELTNEFYSVYASIRREVLEQLRQSNPSTEAEEILRCTQKLLDRVLFCAFCEDRGLLPAESLKQAFQHSDPYNPRPIWDNFLGLFRAIDKGNDGLKIPAYNGGLFAHDETLDTLTVSDEICSLFKDIGEYEYRAAQELIEDHEEESLRSIIDVDILGHIFEQSITDLERIRQDIESNVAPLDDKKAKSRRKKEGAFYTPPFITRYIIEQALGGVLRKRFEALRQSHKSKASGTAPKALVDPNAYDLDTLNEPQRKALIRFWEAWQEELSTIRILDPACGSGAFLIEGFDQLFAHFEVSNARLEELRGQRTLFDLNREILQNNLYGVDLNPEAIQICQLSLWIKTAERGKALTSLDHTIREGNSVVGDSSIHPKGFDWSTSFPEVTKQGGFDVVIGNPPYVRQELLSPIKPWLEANYETYHGMADLYVYFYELGMRVLRPEGLLSFVVTNKWMKANYGEPLRRFFSERTWVRSVVDFGHAKQIFKEADVFPSIIVAEKPTKAPKPETARLCSIPRDQLRIDDLSVQIEKEGDTMDLAQLNRDSWLLEPKSVGLLLRKIRTNRKPLKEFIGKRPNYGVKTGFNEAFLIDTEKRDELVAADPKCTELIRPYLRGQDIDRWQSDWTGRWMIFMRRGIDIDTFPSIKSHLLRYRTQLEPKPKEWTGDKWPGRKSGKYQWYEIQDPVEYWKEFDKPKIFYQVIQFHPRYSLDTDGMLSNDKAFFLPSDDLYLLAVLNSPLMWWHNWRMLTHLKDEALSPMGYMIQDLPIANPTPELRESIEPFVRMLLKTTDTRKSSLKSVLDWLKVEFNIEKPGNKLSSMTDLNSDAFVSEVRRIRGKKQPLTAAGLKSLRDEYRQSVEPMQSLATEAQSLEKKLSDLVNQAYELTSEEVALMWQTAPPRMPISAQ